MKHPWLEPLTLKGNIFLPNRIMPGPMDGLMSPLFCSVVNQLDLVDYWITPFIRLNNTFPKTKILQKWLSHFDLGKRPVIVQLLGNNPAIFADAAKVFRDLGVSGINLNFCCPSNKVVSKNGGGKLLTQLDLMLEIIESISNAIPDLSLSVKLRSGLSSPDEMNDFLPKLSKCDLDFIMLHFRTVKEMYRDVSDSSFRISQAVKFTNPIPLIASGDIFSLSDAKTMFTDTSCGGITVARGLLKDPFLIRRIQHDLENIKISHSSENMRYLFLKTMCKIVKDKKKSFSRPTFIEISRFMWGRNSEMFKEIISLTDKDILNYFL